MVVRCGWEFFTSQQVKSSFERETGKAPKEDRAAYWRWWYKRNRVEYAKRHTEYQKRWRAKNPEYYKLYLKKRYAEDPTRAARYQETYNAKHADRLRTMRRNKLQRVYATPEGRAKILSYGHNRKAKKRAAKSPDAVVAIRHILKSKTVSCFYCGKRLPAKQRTIEHINPLHSGGAHSAFNIVPACKWCNDHKQGRNANAFIRTGQLILVY